MRSLRNPWLVGSVLVLGMLLAAGYFTYVYRSFSGKVAIDKDSHGYGS